MVDYFQVTGLAALSYLAVDTAYSFLYPIEKARVIGPVSRYFKKEFLRIKEDVEIRRRDYQNFLLSALYESIKETSNKRN